MGLPLNGVRIADMTQALAGPYGARFLGDLGAEVIKIETPGIGDMTRKFAGPSVKGESGYFIAINRNKKSITLNLKSKQGIDLFYQLVRKSDVILENNRVGMMEKLGIGYSTLKQIKPDIIFTSVTGFGQTGPYARFPAYEIIAQAMGGMMDLTGFPEGPPLGQGLA